MSAENRWADEEAWWTMGAAEARRRMSPVCLMVFPEGVMQGDQIIAGLADSPRWDSVRITDRRMAEQGDIVVLAYRAQAVRGGELGGRGAGAGAAGGRAESRAERDASDGAASDSAAADVTNADLAAADSTTARGAAADTSNASETIRDVLCSSTWLRAGGDWLMVQHQQTQHQQKRAAPRAEG